MVTISFGHRKGNPDLPRFAREIETPAFMISKSRPFRIGKGKSREKNSSSHSSNRLPASGQPRAPQSEIAD